MNTSEKIFTIIRDSKGLSLTEIQKKAQMQHKPVVLYHLDKLINNGRIIKENKIYTFLSEKEQKFIQLPYYGKAQAGNDAVIRENDNPESYIPIRSADVPGNPKDLFLMHVKGDSMEPSLSEDQLIVFKWCRDIHEVKDGEVIVCRVNEGELKIKRFKNMKIYGILLSDNKEKYEPIIVNDENFKMIGKMVKVLG